MEDLRGKTAVITGGAGGIGRAMVLLAAIALVVLPIVDLTLAVVPPETDRSTDAIDQVNVFNDLARVPGGPCVCAVVP